jgi:hypothetical protein
MLYVVVTGGLFAGCASRPVGRDPSEYLLTTDRDAQSLLKDIRTALEGKKYKIRKEDPSAGLLVAAPRKFSFEREGTKVTARQVVNLRQEGGSVKLRIVYECNYAGDGQTFDVCYVSDNEATAKINRVEPALLDVIRPFLMKHANSAEEAKGFEEDWGAAAPAEKK